MRDCTAYGAYRLWSLDQGRLDFDSDKTFYLSKIKM